MDQGTPDFLIEVQEAGKRCEAIHYMEKNHCSQPLRVFPEGSTKFGGRDGQSFGQKEKEISSKTLWETHVCKSGE